MVQEISSWMQTKVFCCASCRHNNNSHVHERVSCSRIHSRQKESARQATSNWRKTQNRRFGFHSKRTCLNHRHEMQQNWCIYIQKKGWRSNRGSWNWRCYLKQDWILWTGSFVWNFMRIEIPHSFCVASWMLVSHCYRFSYEIPSTFRCRVCLMCDVLWF